MNETCVLAFTPVGDQIQEVQNCTMSTGVNVVNSVSTGSVASTSTVSQLLHVCRLIKIHGIHF
jgi:hypothetical protein